MGENMSENLVSVTECTRIFGVTRKTVEEYQCEGSTIAEGSGSLVDTESFFVWMMNREANAYSSPYLDGCRLNELKLKEECEKLETTIAIKKGLLNPDRGVDDARISYFENMVSAFSEDFAAVQCGGDYRLMDEVVARHRIILEETAAYLSRKMTEQGRSRIRKILRGIPGGKT